MEEPTPPENGQGDPYKPIAPKVPDGETTKKKKIKVKLRNGKEREIKYMVSTSFWSANGKPVSAEEFLADLFGGTTKDLQRRRRTAKTMGKPINT